jgi:activator of HSP90 ATPase
MKTKTIKQTATLTATPNEVYDALMDSKKHSKFTGGKCTMSTKVGGKFTAYDGYIHGENLELARGKKIVQSWNSSDFPAGHFSKTTYNFSKTKTGTKISFTHSGVPDDQFKSVKQGWIDYYWTPMKKMFDKK